MPSTLSRRRWLPGFILCAGFALPGAAAANEPHVTIQTKIVEVERSALDAFGVDFGRKGYRLTGRKFSGLPMLGPLLDGPGVLADPSAVTRSGQAATLEVDGAELGLANEGLTLDVVPTVSGDGGFIQLNVVLRLSGVPGSQSPPVATRVRADVVNGGSVVIGGAFAATAEEGGPVPALSKVPILGRLFRSAPAERQEDSLIVIITPWLVDLDGRRSGSPGHRPQIDPNVSAPRVPVNTPGHPQQGGYRYGPPPPGWKGAR